MPCRMSNQSAAWGRALLWKLQVGSGKLRAALASLRHPKGMTCLDCGFLAVGDGEVRRADRVHLWAHDRLACPPLNKLHCIRKLWVSHDLGYLDAGPDAFFDELQKKRRPCEGYLKYRPGWSPAEHKELLQKRLDLREKILFTSAGAIGTLVLTFLGKWLLNAWGIK